MNMCELTYKYDDDNGLIMFYIDGIFFDEWLCDGGDPEMEFKLFRNIYTAGYKDGSTR